MGDSRIIIPVIVGVLILGSTLPVAMGHGFVDQSCDCANNLSNGLSEFGISGQEFTPTVNNLVGVDILLFGFFAEGQTENITVRIWEESIGTKFLGEATQTVSGGREFITVHYDFDEPIPLTPGIIHVIQVEGTGFFWLGDFGNNPYPDGAAYLFGMPNPQYDLMFRTYFESPTIEEVEIDIKPGSDPNAIQPFKMGVTPVVILSSSTFSAETVDFSTVTFGPDEATPVHKKPHLEDVNNDGLIDMVLHFKTKEIGIEQVTTELCLKAQTFDGTDVVGCDAIVVVPKS